MTMNVLQYHKYSAHSPSRNPYSHNHSYHIPHSKTFTQYQNTAVASPRARSSPSNNPRLSISFPRIALCCQHNACSIPFQWSSKASVPTLPGPTAESPSTQSPQIGSPLHSRTHSTPRLHKRYNLLVLLSMTTALQFGLLISR